MKAFLCLSKELRIPLIQDYGSGVTHRRAQITIEDVLAYDDSSESKNDLIVLKKAVREYFGELQTLNPVERTLCVHFKTIPETSDKMICQVHGEFLDELYNLFSYDLQLHVTGGHSDTGCMTVKTPDYFPSESLVAHCSNEGVYCETENCSMTYTLYDWMSRPGHAGSQWFSIAFIVNPVNFASPIDKMSICKKILSDGINADVTIVASNGAEVKCHKTFLIAHSDVLTRMLVGGFQEASTSRIVMNDISEQGLKALLAYLYSWDVTQPTKKIEIAVELLEVGHKYGIAPLESKMRRMLIARPNHWFEVDQAMQLFHLARSVEQWEDLKKKAVQVLKSKSGEVLASEEYKSLFQNKSEMGNQVLMDLVSALLTV